jgi:arabinofuranosyltransferase
MSKNKLLAYAIPVAVVLLLRAVLPASLYDDAYISFRVAQNLAVGHGMVFNPGEHVYV